MPVSRTLDMWRRLRPRAQDPRLAALLRASEVLHAELCEFGKPVNGETFTAWERAMDAAATCASHKPTLRNIDVAPGMNDDIVPPMLDAIANRGLPSDVALLMATAIERLRRAEREKSDCAHRIPIGLSPENADCPDCGVLLANFNGVNSDLVKVEGAHDA